MANSFHISAMFFGLLAYAFSDVNSASGFTNTFLPLIVMLCFIYGLIVTVSLFVRSRKNTDSQNKSADLLLMTMKELKDQESEQNKSDQNKADQNKADQNKVD